MEFWRKRELLLIAFWNKVEKFFLLYEKLDECIVLRINPSKCVSV